jgi:hypothetical protein
VGAAFAQRMLEFPWGYVAQLLDPDLNRLQIRKGRWQRGHLDPRQVWLLLPCKSVVVAGATPP